MHSWLLSCWWKTGKLLCRPSSFNCGGKLRIFCILCSVVLSETQQFAFDYMFVFIYYMQHITVSNLCKVHWHPDHKSLFWRMLEAQARPGLVDNGNWLIELKFNVLFETTWLILEKLFQANVLAGILRKLNQQKQPFARNTKVNTKLEYLEIWSRLCWLLTQ